MKLGDFIRNYRDDNDLSLRDFANKSGLSHAYIAKLESGIDPRSGKKVEPTMDTIKRIAKATDTSIVEILKEIGYINNKNNEKANACNIDKEVKEIICELGHDFTDMLRDLKGMTEEEKESLMIFLQGMKLRRNKYNR